MDQERVEQAELAVVQGMGMAVGEVTLKVIHVPTGGGHGQARGWGETYLALDGRRIGFRRNPQTEST